METPLNLQGFTLVPLPLNFSPKPGTPFNDAVLRVGQMSFVEVRRTDHWLKLFPYPLFDSTHSFTFTGRPRIGGKSENEQRLEWERDASRFFDECKKKIEWQKNRLAHEFKQNLDLWALRGRPINIDATFMAASWCGKHSEMPMAEFYQLYITAQTVKDFFQEFAQKWERDRALPEGSIIFPPPIITNSQKRQGGAQKKSTMEQNHINLTLFRECVREKVGEALKTTNELSKTQKKEILKYAMTKTADKKSISTEKLRKDITPKSREEIFGKIYRDELEHKEFYINKLR